MPFHIDKERESRITYKEYIKSLITQLYISNIQQISSILFYP